MNERNQTTGEPTCSQSLTHAQAADRMGFRLLRTESVRPIVQPIAKLVRTLIVKKSLVIIHTG